MEALGRAIQKPQSMFSGGILGLSRVLGTMDPDSPYLSGASNPLTGLLEGWKQEIHPHDLLNEAAGNEDNSNWGRKIANTAFDITVDPLMFAGPAVKGGLLGSKAAGLGEAALSAGKLGEGVGTGSKLLDAAARFGRRTYQGTLATGDPLSGAGLGQLMGIGENQLAKLLPKIGTRAVEGALTDTADDIPSAIRELGPGPIRGRMPGFSGTTAPEGEVITPEVVRRALGQSTQQALPVGPRMPELGPAPARSGPFTGDPGPMKYGSNSIEAGQSPFGELGPATAMPMGPGFDRAMGPAGAGNVDEMVRQLLGRSGKVSGDNLAQIFRMILQGQ